jgi:hypothetical protein
VATVTGSSPPPSPHPPPPTGYVIWNSQEDQYKSLPKSAETPNDSALKKTWIGSQDLNLLNDREYNNKLRIWRRISLCICRSASSTLQGLFCLHFENVFKKFWSVQQLAVESLHLSVVFRYITRQVASFVVWSCWICLQIDKDREPFNLVALITPDSTRIITVNAVINYLLRKKLSDMLHKKEVEIFSIA